jgi:hypothetical protein
VKEMRKMGLCMFPTNNFEEINHFNESRYESLAMGFNSTFVCPLINSSEKNNYTRATQTCRMVAISQLFSRCT